MRAVIDVARDREGRLVGDVKCSGCERRAFIGLMELVGLIEDGLDARCGASDSKAGGRTGPPRAVSRQHPRAPLDWQAGSEGRR